jgi:hypothetical protein
MEGVLEKWDENVSGLFKSKGQWNKYYFVLHEEILMFTEVNYR